MTKNHRVVSTLPQHVAIIMDGNGRWALKRGMPRTYGHLHGVSAMRRVIRHALNRHIPYLTLFAFGIDNWKRTEDEVRYLMHLLSRLLIKRELMRLMQAGIVLRFIGDLSMVFRDYPKLQSLLQEAESYVVPVEKMRLTIALSYSGRWDMLTAVRRMSANPDLSADTITEDVFRAHMALDSTIPDPDLLIRTSGVQRLSDFLLWYLSYTELYFSEVLWPDFNARLFDEALLQFGKRERRFGKESVLSSESL